MVRLIHIFNSLFLNNHFLRKAHLLKDYSPVFINGNFSYTKSFEYRNTNVVIYQSYFQNFCNNDCCSSLLFLKGKDSYLNCSESYFINCTNLKGFGGAITFMGRHFRFQKSHGYLCKAVDGSEFAFFMSLYEKGTKDIFSSSTIYKCSDDIEDTKLGSTTFRNTNICASLNNITNNKVMFYGSGFVLHNCHGSLITTSNIINNTGKNLIYCENSEYVSSISKCNIIGNIGKAASLFLVYGFYRVSSCVYIGNSYYLATFDWHKKGSIVIIDCVFDIEYNTTRNVYLVSCNVKNNQEHLIFVN